MGIVRGGFFTLCPLAERKLWQPRLFAKKGAAVNEPTRRKRQFAAGY
jgi:hypothetical protein